MKNTTKLITLTVLLILIVLTACAPGETVLQVTGAVGTPKDFTAKQLAKMDTSDAEYTNKDGETSTFNGVLVTSLLDEAGLNAEATSVVLIAADGYTAEITLEELNACTGCILVTQEEGGYKSVMPGFTGKIQVRDLVTIEVK